MSDIHSLGQLLSGDISSPKRGRWKNSKWVSISFSDLEVFYIDHPPGERGGGGDVDLSGRRGVLRLEGWWDLALRGVLSLETHIDSAGLLVPPLPVERNMCKINMFSQPCSGVARQDRTAEGEGLRKRQHRERERGSISCGSSCCQGHRQSEAVLGLGSNVGWVIAVIEMWRGPLKYSITQVFKRFKEINL